MTGDAPPLRSRALRAASALHRRPPHEAAAIRRAADRRQAGRACRPAVSVAAALRIADVAGTGRRASLRQRRAARAVLRHGHLPGMPRDHRRPRAGSPARPLRRTACRWRPADDPSSTLEECDVLIVGAGPAGMAAAVAAASGGGSRRRARRQPGAGRPDLARRPRRRRCPRPPARCATRMAQPRQRPRPQRHARRRRAGARRTAARRRRARLAAAVEEADPVHRRARTAAAVPRLDAARRDRRGRPAGAGQGRLAGGGRTHRDRRQRAVAAGRGGHCHARPARRCCASPSRPRCATCSASRRSWRAGRARRCRR